MNLQYREYLDSKCPDGLTINEFRDNLETLANKFQCRVVDIINAKEIGKCKAMEDFELYFKLFKGGIK